MRSSDIDSSFGLGKPDVRPTRVISLSTASEAIAASHCVFAPPEIQVRENTMTGQPSQPASWSEPLGGGPAEGPHDGLGWCLRTLRAVADELNRHQSPGPMLDSVVPLVVESLGFEAGWVFLRREPDGFFLASSYRVPAGLAADDYAVLNRGVCRCQRRLLTGDLVTATWLEGCERLRWADAAGRPTGGLQFHVCVPLLAGGRVIGLMNLAMASPDSLSPELTTLLDIIGRLVGVALERALVVSEAQTTRQREHDEASELARALLDVTTVGDLGRVLFLFLRRVLEPDALSLLVVDLTGTYLTLVAGWGWSEPYVGRLQLPLKPPESSGPAWVLHTREPAVFELGSMQRPFFVPEPVRRAGVRQSLMLPMFSGDRPVGVVAVNWLEVRAVPEERIKLASLLCGISANVLARVLELQQLNEVIQRLPVGSYRSTPEGRFLAVNDALVRLLGYPDQATLLATPVQTIYVNPKDRVRWQRLIERKGVLTGFEVRWRRFDGTPVWVRESARVVRDATGRVAYYEGAVEDITERKRSEEQARFLAEHDPLTGIFNRRRFQAELLRRLNLAERTGRSGAILLIDLDNFKDVNDSLGHQAGDQLLQELAALMKSRLRPGDVLARLGGDEFGVILFPADAEQAGAVARRILGAIRERAPLLGGNGARMAASCGIAVFPDHGQAADEILSAADRALYAAKGRGGDQVEVWCQGTGRAHRPIGDQLVRALAENGLEIFVQPILDLKADRITQYELLARLAVGSDLLKPAAFLEAAERLGLVTEVDLKVLTGAIRLAKGTNLRLHVNISGRTLNDPRAVERILRLLESAKVDPDRVVLEITEETVLADLGVVRRHLETLRERGYRLALDDFGAGFSSFRYLRYLPVDYVKIDGSLIRDLSNDVAAQKIVRAVAALIRDLGGAAVAEWVEDEGTLRTVRALGIDYAQGFYIGVPVPVAEILAGGTQPFRRSAD